MWQGTERIEIAGPPEAVWAVVSDVARHAQLAGSGEVKAVRTKGPLAAGAMWEADEVVRGMGAFTATSECLAFDPPHELSWKSYPPPVKKGDPDSVPDITWWYRLSPSERGTVLEHAFQVIEPKHGGLMVKVYYLLTRRATTIRRGMRRTLANVKAAVEG